MYETSVQVLFFRSEGGVMKNILLILLTFAFFVGGFATLPYPIETTSAEARPAQTVSPTPTITPAPTPCIPEGPEKPCPTPTPVPTVSPTPTISPTPTMKPGD
jgi:hypothetical protein